MILKVINGAMDVGPAVSGGTASKYRCLKEPSDVAVSMLRVTVSSPVRTSICESETLIL